MVPTVNEIKKKKKKKIYENEKVTFESLREKINLFFLISFIFEMNDIY